MPIGAPPGKSPLPLHHSGRASWEWSWLEDSWTGPDEVSQMPGCARAWAIETFGVPDRTSWSSCTQNALAWQVASFHGNLSFLCTSYLFFSAIREEVSIALTATAAEASTDYEWQSLALAWSHAAAGFFAWAGPWSAAWTGSWPWLCLWRRPGRFGGFEVAEASTASNRCGSFKILIRVRIVAIFA